MKKRSGGGRLGLILALPFLDLALLRMILISVRGGRAETGLFIVFYLQFVPQEILLRTFLGKKKTRGWRYWAGWICRWSGIMAAALSVLLLLSGGGWETLILPGLYESRHWIAMALIPLRWIFAVSGTVILICGKATRKKALLLPLAAFPVLLMAFAIVGTQPSVSGNRDLTNLFGSVTILLIPHLYGLWGALTSLKPGETAAENGPAAKQAAPAAPAAAGSVPPSSVPSGPQPAAVPARSPVPRPSAAAPARSSASRPAPQKPAPPQSREQELKDLKAAYEARMHTRAEIKGRTPREIPTEEMLQQTADRLFSEGRAEMELGGQRQWIYWLVRAVPALGGLLTHPAGIEFFSPSLPDEPEMFLPLRDALAAEAARLLRDMDGPPPDKEWEGAEPETLCAGWYALTRLASACEDGIPFSAAAAALAGFFEKNDTCRLWLEEAFESVGGKEPL